MKIVSPSHKPSVLAAKIADYRAVDVREIWVVRAETQRVEVIRLSIDEIETVSEYGQGTTVASPAFPDQRIEVDSIFAMQ